MLADIFKIPGNTICIGKDPNELWRIGSHRYVRFAFFKSLPQYGKKLEEEEGQTDCSLIELEQVCFYPSVLSYAGRQTISNQLPKPSLAKSCSFHKPFQALELFLVWQFQGLGDPYHYTLWPTSKPELLKWEFLGTRSCFNF